jgi:hypothetical protein
MSADDQTASGQAEDSSAARDGTSSSSDLDRRIKLVAAHVLAGVTLLSLWAATDAWQAVTGLRAAALLSVLAAIPAGVVFGTLVHEWGHFAGARLGGARYTIPDRLGLFVFNYDFGANSVSQFFTMSWGGQIGGALAVVLLWWALPLDTAGRAMIVAAAIGAFFFAGTIEWPVLSRTRVSGNPLAELSKIDRDVLYRSASVGAVAGLLAWALIA